MTEGRDAKLLQVLRREVRQDRLVYLVLAERRLVLPKAQAPQPDYYLHDGAYQSGRRASSFGEVKVSRVALGQTARCELRQGGANHIPLLADLGHRPLRAERYEGRCTRRQNSLRKKPSFRFQAHHINLRQYRHHLWIETSRQQSNVRPVLPKTVTGSTTFAHLGRPALSRGRYLLIG
jgi:hypothetical protein